MMTSILSSKGQVKLPRKVQRALKLKPGARVVFLLGEEGVLLRPAAGLRSLSGSLARYAFSTHEGRGVRGIVKKEVARAAAKEG